MVAVHKNKTKKKSKQRPKTEFITERNQKKKMELTGAPGERVRSYRDDAAGQYDLWCRERAKDGGWLHCGVNVACLAYFKGEHGGGGNSFPLALALALALPP